MKTISMMAAAAAIAFSAVAFTATPGAAKTAPITSPERYCLSYEAGGDCGFISYAQCEATASGIGGTCTLQKAAHRAGDHPAHGNG